MTNETDREYQLRNVDAIFHEARFSPHFRPNPKFPDDGSCVFRIAYRDVMNYQYVIRKAPLDADRLFWSEDTEVVASYESAKALVADGWRLD